MTLSDPPTGHHAGSVPVPNLLPDLVYTFDATDPDDRTLPPHLRRPGPQPENYTEETWERMQESNKPVTWGQFTRVIRRIRAEFLEALNPIIANLHAMSAQLNEMKREHEKREHEHETLKREYETLKRQPSNRGGRR